MMGMASSTVSRSRAGSTACEAGKSFCRRNEAWALQQEREAKTKDEDEEGRGLVRGKPPVGI